jgi:DNA-binding transcriptional ArsR family regulator
MAIDNRKISLDVGYFVLAPRVMIPKVGLVTANVFGLVWGYCQGSDLKCHASQQRLADDIGISRRSIQYHLNRLVEAGYLRSELNPGVGVTYYDTEKVTFEAQLLAKEKEQAKEQAKEQEQEQPTHANSAQVEQPTYANSAQEVRNICAQSESLKESLKIDDDDESRQISEILESKTAIKPINQQTINDLKALMLDKGRDVGGLTIDDLLAGIQDHATNPKAEAPTFATIGGLVRWAVTFKRNAKGKRKGGKGGHEFNKNNPPVYYQGDPDPEELNAYIEFVRERCIKAGYIMPNQAFPEDDTERNQLIDDFKSGHRIDEFKEYLQTIKQPQEAIPF